MLRHSLAALFVVTAFSSSVRAEDCGTTATLQSLYHAASPSALVHISTGPRASFDAEAARWGMTRSAVPCLSTGEHLANFVNARAPLIADAVREQDEAFAAALTAPRALFSAQGLELLRKLRLQYRTFVSGMPPGEELPPGASIDFSSATAEGEPTPTPTPSPTPATGDFRDKLRGFDMSKVDTSDAAMYEFARLAQRLAPTQDNMKWIASQLGSEGSLDSGGNFNLSGNDQGYLGIRDYGQGPVWTWFPYNENHVGPNGEGTPPPNANAGPPDPVEPQPEPLTDPVPTSSGDVIDLHQVTVVKGVSIADWSVNSRITQAYAGNGLVCTKHTMTGRWRAVPYFAYTDAWVEGNMWFFAKIGGKWYGGAGDWLEVGQDCRDISCWHVGDGVFYDSEPLKSWKPKKGELVAVAASAPARAGQWGDAVRTNVVFIRWPCDVAKGPGSLKK